MVLDDGMKSAGRDYIQRTCLGMWTLLELKAAKITRVSE